MIEHPADAVPPEKKRETNLSSNYNKDMIYQTVHAEDEEETVFSSAIKCTKVGKEGLYLVGFPFDGTACYRKGTVEGPKFLRKSSYHIETYSPYVDADTELDEVDFYDLGNLPVGNSEDVEANWQKATDSFFHISRNGQILKDNKFRFLTLGGEHSISYAPIVSALNAYPDLVLIHLDAHADLRDGYDGYHYSHASIIRRVLDHFGDQHQLIQYGIRSGTKEEFSWMKENNTVCTSRDEFFQRIDAIAQGRPVYLTLDLDFFDPSFFPGTGTPEPGGEDFHTFIKLIKKLRSKYFIGADVTELSPKQDACGISSVMAAKVVRELILLLR